MNPPAAPLSPGVIVAETYEIERQLGRGGMGEVWLARHLRLAGKQVAIKVLHVDRQLPQETLARFKREAEIAARLEHPNIVQVMDFNTLPSGQPFIVMEYLKGQSLAARARGQPMTVEQVSAVMLQVGSALQAAHRAGVVHRDLKPENIFLVPTALGDSVKVLDFGISKLSDSNTVETTEAVLLGTPLYMSPEQALGNNKDVSPQSDLFSLGSITFELLSGRAPFFADNVAKVVFRIAYEAPPSLKESRPDLPVSVLNAVTHALEKERSKRTPNIETFVEELTGQRLVNVAEVDESSGLYRTGVAVTPSMISGRTIQPTPAPETKPEKEPAEVSGKSVVIFIVVLTLVIAGAVTKVRMANWAEREEYRTSMRDAGWVMLDDGNFVKPDAGVAVVVDAGVPVVEEIDAGIPVVDAGTVAVKEPSHVETAIPKEEAALLESLKADHRAENWPGLWSRRNQVFELKHPRAREAGFREIIEAACHRRDNAGISPVLAEYRLFASQAQRAAMKKACVASYAESESFDW